MMNNIKQHVEELSLKRSRLESLTSILLNASRDDNNAKKDLEVLISVILEKIKDMYTHTLYLCEKLEI